MAWRAVWDNISQSAQLLSNGPSWLRENIIIIIIISSPEVQSSEKELVQLINQSVTQKLLTLNNYVWLTQW